MPNYTYKSKYECGNCLFMNNCPCGYSYNNAACLTIHSKYPSLSDQINQIREILENDTEDE